ncbi:hypothetical protein Tco_1057508 [Tanacetum coccineum]|uniref:Uncharacterized protein n=1 Tax=Tanacetum coccineum TaxID=301880 RepID=A0ABQ5H5P0_9ASTR
MRHSSAKQEFRSEGEFRTAAGQSQISMIQQQLKDLQSHMKCDADIRLVNESNAICLRRTIDCSNIMYICQSFKGKTRSLVTKKTDISYVRSSRNSNLMNIHQMTLDHSSSSLGPHCLMMSVHISSGLVLHLDVGIHCISKFPSIYIQLFWNTLTHDAKTGRSLLHDNIVPKPDLALELGKSISLTEAEEEAVAREVHATHARIVSESEPEPTQRRQSGIAFRDSFIVSKKRSSDSSKKLKGIQTLTPAEQEAADIMKALKESKKMSKRQPGTGGSNEGTGNILGVPDESTVVSRASSEGTGSKPGVPDEEKLILEWEADVVFYGRFSFYDPNADIIKEVKQEVEKRKRKNIRDN